MADEALAELRRKHAIEAQGGATSVRSTIGIVVGGGKNTAVVTMVRVRVRMIVESSALGCIVQYIVEKYEVACRSDAAVRQTSDLIFFLLQP